METKTTEDLEITELDDKGMEKVAGGGNGVSDGRCPNCDTELVYVGFYVWECPNCGWSA